MDPKKHPWESDYSVFGGNPIYNKDILGDKWINDGQKKANDAGQQYRTSRDKYLEAESDYKKLVNSGANSKKVAKAHDKMIRMQSKMNSDLEAYNDAVKESKFIGDLLGDMERKNPVWYNSIETRKNNDRSKSDFEAHVGLTSYAIRRPEGDVTTKMGEVLQRNGITVGYRITLSYPAVGLTNNNRIKELIDSKVDDILHSLGHWWMGVKGYPGATHGEGNGGEDNANRYMERVKNNSTLEKIENGEYQLW